MYITHAVEIETPPVYPDPGRLELNDRPQAQTQDTAVGTLIMVTATRRRNIRIHEYPMNADVMPGVVRAK